MSQLNLVCSTKSAGRSSRLVYAVRAGLDPQVLLRIAGLFAQRDNIPHQLSCRTTPSCLLIDIEVAIETPAIANIMLEKLRSIVLVERVSLLEGAC